MLSATRARLRGVTINNARTFASSGPSFLDTLLNKSSTPRVPLDVVYPGVDIPAGTETVKRGAIQVTKLPNGMRVATDSTPSAVADLGVFVNTGSRYETDDLAGITTFFERMCLKSTKNRSAFRFVRDMAKTAVNVSASTSRDGFQVVVDAPLDSLDVAIGTLADVTSNPAFIDKEISEEIENYQHDADERAKAADQNVSEAFYLGAYSGKSYGRPLFANASSIHNFNSNTLTDFHKTFFTPNNMLVAAVGVPHDAFVHAVQETFVGLPENAKPGQEYVPDVAKYTGGEVRESSRDYTGPTHVALGFEAPNVLDKDFYTLSILHTLLGGGGSFSAGGPGKGMHSRLYTNVLAKHHFVESTYTFNGVFKETGVFGVYGVANHQDAGKLTDVLCTELLNAAKVKDDVELQRAKNQMIGTFLHSIESRNIRLLEMGRTLAFFDKVDFESIPKKLEAVTAKDIEAVVKKMIKSPLTIATYGNATNIPRYDVIAKRFA